MVAQWQSDWNCPQKMNRCPLNDFMTQWTEKLASLLQDLHADWSEERRLQAKIKSVFKAALSFSKVSQRHPSFKAV